MFLTFHLAVYLRFLDVAFRLFFSSLPDFKWKSSLEKEFKIQIAERVPSQNANLPWLPDNPVLPEAIKKMQGEMNTKYLCI